MAERRLKRLLGLPEALMLAVAGTIAAEVFVLTGHVAGMAGPASVLALLLIGVLGYSFALSYAELATAFPVTGGALTYVREAYGKGLLSFLVGSLDCLSSTFYAALSAVGFAYSLRLLIPALPVIPVAVVIVAVFTVLNVLGVSNVGKAQIVLGAILLSLLATYIVLGFVRPEGFHWQVFMPDGRLFIHEKFGANVGSLLATMALIFNAFIGFEIVADDAEEFKRPERNIPLALLISLAVITLLYTLITLVTLGTVPWHELAGSESALAQAATRFMPRWGSPLIAVAGIIATLTSVNSAMLSATREALTLSRDGLWPRFMSRLGRLRTPYAASLVIGAIVAAVSVVGLVDFLSYISSSGYLFVVFWASLAMIRLRKQRPELARPFKAPLFPWIPCIAAATCAIVVGFTAWKPLLFGIALLGTLTLAYYLRGPMSVLLSNRLKSLEPARNRILLAVANPRTAEGLARLATLLAGEADGTSVSVLSVVAIRRKLLPRVAQQFSERFAYRQRALLAQVANYVESRNIPFYVKIRSSQTIAQGVLDEIESYSADRLVLMGWPGPLEPEHLADNPVARVLADARTHVAVLLNRDLGAIRRILVPVGGGPHSRLALRLACQIATHEDAQVTVAYCSDKGAGEVEEMHDELFLLREIIESELGDIPPYVTTKVIYAEVHQGILEETRRQHYDLAIIGAAVLCRGCADLFGVLTDELAQQIPCSVLLVRRYEPATIEWVRRRVKRMAGVPGRVPSPSSVMRFVLRGGSR